MRFHRLDGAFALILAGLCALLAWGPLEWPALFWGGLAALLVGFFWAMR